VSKYVHVISLIQCVLHNLPNINTLYFYHVLHNSVSTLTSGLNQQFITQNYKIGKELHKSILHLQLSTKLDGLGDLQIRGEVISTVKYAYDHVILANEETVQRGFIDRMIEIGNWCGIEMSMEETKVMRI